MNLEFLEPYSLANGLYTEDKLEEDEIFGARVVRQFLPRILEENLTGRQRQYVQLYYFEQKSMPRIARELGVNKSSVQRGLAAARRKLEKAMRPFF